jgi:hypothetical protein
VPRARALLGTHPKTRAGPADSGTDRLAESPAQPTEPASHGSEPPSLGTPVVPLAGPPVPFYLEDSAPVPSDDAPSFPEYLQERNLVLDFNMEGKTTLSTTFRETCEALMRTAAQLAIHPQWSDHHMLVPFGPRPEDSFCILKANINHNQSKQYSQVFSVLDILGT